MYYLFLAKTLRNRTLKFKPKIASTFRPHGKWGDMIICILPLSWCLNILVSSNYLLKVLEWQAESSLFTIRVRGKQWYWVYKFDFRNFTDIISAPRNVGRNKWTYSFCGEIQTSSNYYHLMQLRSQSKFIKKFWGSNLDKFTEESSSNNIALIENYLRGTRKIKQLKQSKRLNFKFPCANINHFSGVIGDVKSGAIVRHVKDLISSSEFSLNKKPATSNKNITTLPSKLSLYKEPVTTNRRVVTKKIILSETSKSNLRCLEKLRQLEVAKAGPAESKRAYKRIYARYMIARNIGIFAESAKTRFRCNIMLEKMSMDYEAVCNNSERLEPGLCHFYTKIRVRHMMTKLNKIYNSYKVVNFDKLRKVLVSKDLPSKLERCAVKKEAQIAQPQLRTQLRKQPRKIMSRRSLPVILERFKARDMMLKSKIESLRIESSGMWPFNSFNYKWYNQPQRRKLPLMVQLIDNKIEPRESLRKELLNGSAVNITKLANTWPFKKRPQPEQGPHIFYNNTKIFKKKVSFLKFKSGLSYFQIFDKKQPYSISSCMSREDSFKDIKNQMGKKNPIHLVKNQVYNDTLNVYKDNYMLRFKFHDKNAVLEDKTTTKPLYFCFKQKRYKKRRYITQEYSNYNYKSHKKKSLSFRGNHILKNNYNIESETAISNKEKKPAVKVNLKMIQDLRKKYNVKTSTEGSTRLHGLIRKSRSRGENLNVTLSKRLLRVKKTLVIPTHVNITAITNSYDVVHSWFIPGLGLKMDCVPGRSTHHTFYVDNAGFYYGQCAEICGRYHHHMPIRVCALPFEHFLLWWNNFGLPHLMQTGKKDFIKEYSFRKYSW